MFKKNDPNINRRGRPPKAINRLSRPLKMRVADFIDEKFDELPSIWLKLSPRDQYGFIRDLLPFFLAKKSSVDMELNLRNLPEEDIDRIVTTILNKQT